MNKTYLEQLINENLSTREIAERVHKSQTTVRWWLKSYGLKTNIKKYNKGGLARKPKLTTRNFCLKCGEQNPVNFYHRKNSNATRCKKCHNRDSIKRFRKLKERAVEYKGGKCSSCGYNKCLAALDFHHLDPQQKDPNWKAMRNWVFEHTKEELDKCVLLCRNCHAEVHFGD